MEESVYAPWKRSSDNEAYLYKLSEIHLLKLWFGFVCKFCLIKMSLVTSS